MGMMRFGEHKVLEAEANRMLRDYHDSDPSADRSLILTPAKEALRRRREILVSSGTPDRALRAGVYTRAANRAMPHLNSRDGVVPPSRNPQPASRSVSGLSSFMESHLQ